MLQECDCQFCKYAAIIYWTSHVILPLVCCSSRMITVNLHVDNYQNKPCHRKYSGSCMFRLREDERKDHLTRGQQGPKQSEAMSYSGFCSVLKHMPQLSPLTLHCFTLKSGFGVHELDTCQTKLKQQLCWRCTPKSGQSFMGTSGCKSTFGLSGHIWW